MKISEELLKKNGNRIPNSLNQHLQIKESTNTTFLFPVTENEVEKVANYQQELMKCLIMW